MFSIFLYFWTFLQYSFDKCSNTFLLFTLYSFFKRFVWKSVTMKQEGERKKERSSICCFIVRLPQWPVLGQDEIRCQKHYPELPRKSRGSITGTLFCCFSQAVRRELEWNEATGILTSANKDYCCVKITISHCIWLVNKKVEIIYSISSRWPIIWYFLLPKIHVVFLLILSFPTQKCPLWGFISWRVLLFVGWELHIIKEAKDTRALHPQPKRDRK